MGVKSRTLLGVTRGRVVCLAAVPLFLAACGLNQNKSLNLPIVCETESCSCVPEGGGVAAKPPEVKWNTDGTAYCPQGFELYLPPPKSQRWTVGPGI